VSIQIAWAYGSTGSLVHVTQVASGLACKCTCTGCASALEAINPRGGGLVRAHFRHHELPEIGTCSQRTSFLLMREAVRDMTEFSVPIFRGALTRYPGFRAAVTSVEFRSTSEAMVTFDNGRQLLIRIIEGRFRQEALPEDTAAAVLELRGDDPFISSMDQVAIQQAVQNGGLQSLWRRHWISPPETIDELIASSPSARPALPKATGADIWVASPPTAARGQAVVQQYRMLWANTDWEGVLAEADAAWEIDLPVSEAIEQIETRHGLSPGAGTVLNFLRAVGWLRTGSQAEKVRHGQGA
jgi:hypothetical protein